MNQSSVNTSQISSSVMSGIVQSVYIEGGLLNVQNIQADPSLVLSSYMQGLVQNLVDDVCIYYAKIEDIQKEGGKNRKIFLKFIFFF